MTSDNKFLLVLYYLLMAVLMTITHDTHLLPTITSSATTFHPCKQQQTNSRKKMKGDKQNII